jgi:CBS domain-containing protein
MALKARDLMTSEPAFCTPDTPLDQVARLMVQHNCGEIPVIDRAERPVGVVTDRDIVCRVVAEGKNPLAYPAETCMSSPVVTVDEDAPLEDVVAVMEQHQIRRVPVVSSDGRCVGIISQADVALAGAKGDVAELVREVSRDSGGKQPN